MMQDISDHTLLEANIVEFSRLIQMRKEEQAYQEYLEANSLIIKALGFEKYIPQPKIRSYDGKVFIPDFIIKPQNSDFWQILELKRPDTKLDKGKDRRNHWYSDTSSYIAQCEDYAEALMETSVRRVFEAEYGVQLTREVPVTLVAGLSTNIDIDKLHHLIGRCKFNLSLITFDQIVSIAEAYASSLLPEANRNSGFTVGLTFKLLDFTNSVGCIFDIGHAPTKNRVSLYRISENVLSIQILSDSGLRIIKDFAVPVSSQGIATSLMAHVFPYSNSARLVIELNGIQIADVRSSDLSVNLEMPPAIILGSDFNNIASANFVSGQIVVLHPTLNLVERVNKRLWLNNNSSKLAADGNRTIVGLKFANNNFMYTIGHPKFDPLVKPTTDMVQRDSSRRPTAYG